MNIIDEDDGPLVSRYKAEQLEGGAFADVEEARIETSFTSKVTTTGCADTRP